MFYLGVDGGGTKTAFCLIDKKGKVVNRFETSTCHVEQVGVKGMREVFEKFFKNLEDNKIDCRKIKKSFLGIPGFEEVETWDEKIISVVKDFFSDYVCGNDVKASWAGSLKCEPGINLVAGTGAIAYGENEKGEHTRISGWGHFCGDEGSAYWIGKKGIEIFTKQADGRYERGSLYIKMKKHLNLKKDTDIIGLVHDEWKFSRTKIASLCLLVAEAANDGDKYAHEVMKAASEEIALMVKGIVSRIDFEKKIKISYSGGVFKAGDIIIKPLKKHLISYNIDYELVEPALEPVLGSALYAMKLSGIKIEDKIIENLKKS